MRALYLRILLAAALASLAAGFIATHPAAAAELRASVAVKSAIVTLGDLFDGAGPLSDRPVFRAPALGVTGALPAADAIKAAAAAGLAVDRLPAFSSVTVIRRALIVDSALVKPLLVEAAAARLGVAVENTDLTLDGQMEPVAANPSTATPVVVSDLVLQSGSGRFTAALSIDTGDGETRLSISGRALETMAVPVLNRPVDRRDVIHAGDVTVTRIEKRRVPGSAVIHADELIEMAARRPLRAGEVIATADVEPPRIVLRSDIVTLRFSRPGLTLTARGRALSDGARGDLISVLNEQSKRTIQGVVTGAGTVEVNMPGPSVVASVAN